MRPKSALSILLLFVSTPQGPGWLPAPSVYELIGSLVSCDAPLPNRNVRWRAIGIFDRSGFGIIVAGTWLWSGCAGSRTMRNSRNLPTHGSGELPESA